MTQEGRASARLLGTRLPAGTVLDIRHTGAARTCQTAASVEEGYLKIGGTVASNQAIQSEHGSYVHSDEIYSLGWRSGFVSRWLGNEIDPRVIDPPTEAARRILGILLDVDRGNCPTPIRGRLYLHVGHDWDIMALQHHLLGFSPDLHPVAWLGGIVIGWVRDDEIVVVGNGVVKRGNPQEFGLDGDTGDLVRRYCARIE